VRVHSECLTGDALHSLRCELRVSRDAALAAIAREGRGVFLYLHQKAAGSGWPINCARTRCRTPAPIRSRRTHCSASPADKRD